MIWWPNKGRLQKNITFRWEEFYVWNHPLFSYKKPTICNNIFIGNFFARPPINSRVFPISGVIFIGKWSYPPTFFRDLFPIYVFFFEGIPYGPLWSHLIRFGPVWSCFVQYCSYCLVWPWMVLYGPVWPCEVLYGPAWSVWSCMVQYGPVWSQQINFCKDSWTHKTSKRARVRLHTAHAHT